MNRSHCYRVRVDGAEHAVEVAFTGENRDHAVAHVGDRTIQLRRTPDNGWIAAADEHQQTMVWLDHPSRPTAASVGGRAIGLEIQTARAAALADAVAASGLGASGSAAVKAPMPGRVVAILVAEGDAVEIGQPVVIVEAMKMENEVAASSAGRVKSIEVQAGATVDAGAVLVNLDPHPAP